MASDLGRILALSLFFLAAISIEQTKSQENSTNTEVDSDYDQDVLFDVPENPHEKFNQSFYQKAQSYTASNWRKMTAGTVLNMTKGYIIYILCIFCRNSTSLRKTSINVLTTFLEHVFITI